MRTLNGLTIARIKIGPEIMCMSLLHSTKCICSAMAVNSILNERLHNPLNPHLALIEPGCLYVKSLKSAFAMPVVVHGIIVPPLAFSQVIPVLF